MNPVVQHWQQTLESVYKYYRENRPRMLIFFPLLFLFSMAINDLSYWWAMITAFPDLVWGKWGYHYWKVQFPVAILGALFDSLSFFITIYIIKRAIEVRSTKNFLGHLSIDLGIAVAATFWVLFVFMISSWLIHMTETNIHSLAERSDVYSDRALDALKAPTENLRNIYFGMVMGISAMFPTLFHLGLALRSMVVVWFRRPQTA